MSVVDLATADEKMATLSLKLRADSGYKSDVTGYRVSANQWAAILTICEDGGLAQTMKAAPKLLDALVGLLNSCGEVQMDGYVENSIHSDDVATARAAIAAATGGAA